MKFVRSSRAWLPGVALLLLSSGCTTYGKIENLHLRENTQEIRYSIGNAMQRDRSQDVTLVLTFSGGGTRAAALSYGVLQAMRDSYILIDRKPRRVIDEIDLISSVSGGSFTAAYFGLNGDGIFEDFEQRFLRRDVGGELLSGLLSPTLWFSDRGRTEMAVDYYEERLFRGATFEDLYRSEAPVIVINATDLGRGIRFSFLQDSFDLLCSDLSSFPISRAVIASSAVPILFNPVMLQNYANCDSGAFERLEQARARLEDSPQLSTVVDGLATYADKEERQFIHLVDGGLTDNLGLLAIYELAEIAGGSEAFLRGIGGGRTHKLVFVSVNASTKPQYRMEQSNRVASLEDTVNAMTDAQLHTANARTLDLMKQSVTRWAEELSDGEFVVDPYFIQIDFSDIPQPSRRLFFNQIPLSLSLKKEQVDELIRAGRELLLDNPVFKRFLLDAVRLPGD